ncbi:MAG: tol-pal system-associated acyl-CoA thioesterase [Xanthomonadaceae bacterium]|nr:tol-pal system-associated acyl-CoA thioesterase [Xanthomonadaceae bacterium]
MNAFVWPIRVYYEDTDSGGIVYHANYLKYMERARTEWLRARGFDQGRLKQELGVIFVVRSLQIEYEKPAQIDDKLQVVTQVAAQRRASLLFHQLIQREDPEPVVLIRSEVKVACLDSRTLKPRAIPDQIRMELTDVG